MSKKPLESMTNKEHEALIERALEFAKILQQGARGSFSKKEKNFYNKMRHIIENPQSQVLFTKLLESSMRAGGGMAHNFELIAKILRRYSFGDFFTWREKLVLFVFLRVGRYVPQLSVSMFLRQIRKDSQPMLLLLDSFDELESSVKSQHDFLCNFHFIAKSAFSNAIVEENLARVKGALDSPAVSHISIKGRAFYLLGQSLRVCRICYHQVSKVFLPTLAPALNPKAWQNLSRLIWRSIALSHCMSQYSWRRHESMAS